MKILHCSARPFLPFGFFYGSVRTADALLRRLSAAGARCEVASLIPSRRPGGHKTFSHPSFPALRGVGPLFHYRLGRVEVTAARAWPVYYHLLERLLRDPASRPDILWTELELSDWAVKLARREGIATFLWVKDLNGALLAARQAARQADVVACATRYMQDQIRRRLGRRAILIPEAIEPASCVAAGRRRDRVTMVNPVALKGGDIFLKLAALMPERRFLTVSGWTHQAFPGRPPANVEVLPPQYDMRKVFARTAVLIMPSRWEEAFGRVAVEAMLNGIPVAASATGGLPEVIGGGGILIDRAQDLGAWVRAIDLLCNDGPARRRASRIGKSRARLFTPGPAAERLLAAFRKAL